MTEIITPGLGAYVNMRACSVIGRGLAEYFHRHRPNLAPAELNRVVNEALRRFQLTPTLQNMGAV
jgi:hypothetical protein